MVFGVYCSFVEVLFSVWLCFLAEVLLIWVGNRFS